MYSESTADGFAGRDEWPESSACEPGLSPEAVRPLEDNPSPMTVRGLGLPSRMPLSHPQEVAVL